METLLSNGDFEDDLTGWSSTIAVWLGVEGSVTIDTSNPNGGGKCCKLVLTDPGDATGGYLRLYRAVTLKPSTCYRYQLALRGDVDLATFRLRCGDTHEIVPLDRSGISGNNWRHIWYQTKTFAAGTDYFVEVWIQKPPAGETRTLWVDNIAVHELSPRTERWIGVHGDSNVTHLGTLDALEGDASESFLRTSFVKAQRRRNQVFHPVIKSQPGFRVREVYDSLDDITGNDPQPEACVVAVGTNDVTLYYAIEGGNPNYAPAAVAPFFNAIATDLLAAGIPPVFVTIPPRADHDVEPWNDVIRAAGSIAGAQYIDAYAIGVANAFLDNMATYYDDEEGIHYRAAAHVLIGDALGALW